MNQRLKLLAEQAGFDLYEDGNFYSSPPGQWINQEICQFAELIVQECVGVVEGGSFLHDQAPTAIFARECSGAIKRHFGVE